MDRSSSSGLIGSASLFGALWITDVITGSPIKHSLILFLLVLSLAWTFNNNRDSFHSIELLAFGGFVLLSGLITILLPTSIRILFVDLLSLGFLLTNLGDVELQSHQQMIARKRSASMGVNMEVSKQLPSPLVNLLPEPVWGAVDAAVSKVMSLTSQEPKTASEKKERKERIRINVAFVVILLFVDLISSYTFRAFGATQASSWILLAVGALGLPVLLLSNIHRTHELADVESYLDIKEVSDVLERSQRFVSRKSAAFLPVSKPADIAEVASTPVVPVSQSLPVNSGTALNQREENSPHSSGSFSASESSLPKEEPLVGPPKHAIHEEDNDWVVVKKIDVLNNGRLSEGKEDEKSPAASTPVHPFLIEKIPFAYNPKPFSVLKAAKDRLTNGDLFIKHSTKGKPAVRRLKFNVNLRRFEWWSEDMSKLIESANFRDLTGVVRGRKTPGFQKFDSEQLKKLKSPKSDAISATKLIELEASSFALVFNKRKLELEAASNAIREQWIDDIHMLMAEPTRFWIA
jgi:hypothetical protein